MKKNQEANTVLTIYADDLPGLTGQLIYPFNRRDFRLHSLNVARTDIHDRVLITLEAFLPLAALQPFLTRVWQTNGVLGVDLGERYDPPKDGTLLPGG